MKDVAKLAEVSVATVSRVLNNDPRVSSELRYRVLGAVEELNYQRDRIARTLRVQISQIIGLIISDIRNPFFTSVVRGVEDVAYENGYTLLLCNSDEDPDKERLYIDIMLAERVAGVIISPTAEKGNYSSVLLKAGVPVVAIDRRMRDLEVDTVVVQNVGGAYQAVSHLIKLGHHRIGFIGGPSRTTTGRERLEGYEKALIEYQIELDQRLIKTGDFKLHSGYQMTCELLEMDDPPTAVFTCNNLTTLGALNCIHEKGLSIPRDIAIVGFDDMPWATSLNPPLTAVTQPTYEMGCTAANLLLQRIADKDRETVEINLEPILIIRNSCGIGEKSLRETLKR
jgi:DNA-binding LacI/PurR family transcriptional regulator